MPAITLPLSVCVCVAGMDANGGSSQSHAASPAGRLHHCVDGHSRHSNDNSDTLLLQERQRELGVGMAR